MFKENHTMHPHKHRDMHALHTQYCNGGKSLNPQPVKCLVSLYSGPPLPLQGHVRVRGYPHCLYGGQMHTGVLRFRMCFCVEWASGLHLYSAFIQIRFTIFACSYTHSYTDGDVNHAGQQPAGQEQLGLGLGLAQGHLSTWLGGGIELATFWSSDNGFIC